jgi:mannose-6-phosphate isomerase-like protein (cupin superfamily)
MDRKHFLHVAGGGVAAAAVGGILGSAGASAASAGAVAAGMAKGRSSAAGGLYVPNGRDRFERELMIWGVIPLQIKISTSDSGGALFAFEHADMGRGGPPRHFHHDQDEWFYALKGEFRFEVGEESYTLRPGDSLFAPRMIPHVWAYTGEQPGTLLLAVRPAGSLERFFMKSCEMTAPPTPEEAAVQFAAHGMQVVGPPLDIG